MKKTIGIPMVLLVAALVAGCAVKPRPPAFNLYDRQKMVVMPMENLTQDPALGKAIQDDIVGGLVRLNAVPIAEQSAVSDLISRQRNTNMALEENETLRRKMVESLKADIIMVGSIASYTEDVREEEPKRILVSYKNNTYKWGYNDTTSVQVMATVKLIDANTGNLLWVRKSYGDGLFQHWKDLPYSGDNPSAPAEGWDKIRGRTGTAAKDKGTPQQTTPPGQGQGTPVSTAPGGQTIIINVQNTNQQSQQQAQQQQQTQQQTQTAEAAKPKLLYQSDKNVFRARQVAISEVARTVLRDFYGTGGWTPPPRTK